MGARGGQFATRLRLRLRLAQLAEVTVRTEGGEVQAAIAMRRACSVPHVVDGDAAAVLAPAPDYPAPVGVALLPQQPG